MQGWIGSMGLANGMDKQQVLLYGAGNYIQHSVINHNGKGYIICITESLCCTAKLNITKQPHFNKINF